ncbi:MAG: glycosyltransferase family 2 protein [Clostridia bacterium]|nr:glycosyltransferase family 2 protein [Clostridia bacterium]
MELLKLINFIITIIFMVCYSYQFVYIPIVIFFKDRKEKKVKAARGEITLHDYAVLICARNEQAVIGDLLDSFAEQTYPKERLHIFVMADNCTDGTAEKARLHGATVYERKNDELIGKGYALNELLSHINRDYPEKFDGFFIFDADNILKEDFIERMNESFCDGNKVITSYRNSKNYGSSWVSAGIGLWFLRESRYLNNARYILGASCAVSGTGFLFSREVLEENGGWPFHQLTEDIEFSIEYITRGKKIAFCTDAVLYDEQPVKFSQSWRQRLRWSKGYLQVLGKYSGRLIKGIFKGDFSCFDVLMNIAPAYSLSIVSIVCNAVFTVFGLINGGDPMDALVSMISLLLSGYGVAFVVGLVTVITEWKMIRTSTVKKILSVITFPIFMLSFIPVAVTALFAKVTWKPIEHTMTLEKLREEETGK